MDTIKYIKVLGKLLVITTCTLVAVPAYSGQVGYADDSYTSGDTLIAADLNAKFNEIKADVNDADTRSTNNSTQLTNVATGCPANESIAAIDANGTITCETDTDTTYSAGSGLTLSGTTFSIPTSAQALVVGYYRFSSWRGGVLPLA